MTKYEMTLSFETEANHVNDAKSRVVRALHAYSPVFSERGIAVLAATCEENKPPTTQANIGSRFRLDDSRGTEYILCSTGQGKFGLINTETGRHWVTGRNSCQAALDYLDEDAYTWVLTQQGEYDSLTTTAQQAQWAGEVAL